MIVRLRLLAFTVLLACHAAEPAPPTGPSLATAVAAVTIVCSIPNPECSVRALEQAMPDEVAVLREHRDQAEQLLLARVQSDEHGAAYGLALLRARAALPVLRAKLLAERSFHGRETDDPTTEQPLEDDQFPRQLAYVRAMEVISGQPVARAVTLTPPELEILKTEATRGSEPAPARWLLRKLAPAVEARIHTTLWDIEWRHPCAAGADDRIVIGDDVVLACGGRFAARDGRWLAASTLEHPLYLLSDDAGLCAGPGERGVRTCSEGGPPGPTNGKRRVLAANLAGDRLVTVEVEGSDDERLFAVTRAWPSGAETSSATIEGVSPVVAGDATVLVDGRGRVTLGLRRLGRGAAMLARLVDGELRPITAPGLPAIPPHDVVLAADASVAVVVHGELGKVIDLGNDSAIAELEVGGRLLAVAPAGRTVVRAVRTATDGWLDVLDLRAQRYVQVSRHDQGTDVERVQISADGRWLVVGGAWLTGMRATSSTPVGERSPQLVQYPLTSPPAGWRPEDPLESGLYPAYGERYVHGAAEVHIDALAPLHTATDTLDEWAVAVARLHAGVALSAARVDPLYASRVWSDPDGGRQLELMIPACHEGRSNADTWLRVAERGGVRWEVTLVTAAGERPARTAQWLAAFVDGPLGAGPGPRDNVSLARQSCGI